MTKLLIDSSFLFVLFNQRSQKHSLVKNFVKHYKGQLIVPNVVMTEVSFLFNRLAGVHGVLQMLSELQNNAIQLEPILISDLPRIREIMANYQDSKLDFVDCCIMTLAERLDITQVCTFDRRDFSIFRPKHCDYLELLP